MNTKFTLLAGQRSQISLSERAVFKGKGCILRNSSRSRVLIAAEARPGIEDILKVPEITSIAARRGLYLELQTLGPFYKIRCKDGDKEGRLLATTNGFVCPPLKLMHCDTLQVYTRRKAGDEGDRIRGGILGLGALMAVAVFSHGFWSGCRTAEIMAINDDDRTHSRLVRYYSRMFGFEVIREVGGKGLRDFPDLLVWGGVGTRMNGDIESMLRRWSPALRKSDRGR